MRLDPTNWEYYEKRIDMLEKTDMKSVAMRTRLQVRAKTKSTNYKEKSEIIRDFQ